MLAVGFAGAMLAVGEIEGVEDRLRDSERRLDTTTGIRGRSPTPPAEILDDEEFRRLPAVIELYRTALALTRGDGVSTVRDAQRAFDLSPEDDHLVRAGAAGLLGLAYWASGDLEAAHRWYTECVAGLLQAGHTADTFGCALALADIRLAQGRLSEAIRTYENALRRAPLEGGPILRGTADMYEGMSELRLESDDLPAATQALLRSQELGGPIGLPQYRYRSRVAAARIRTAEGDPVGALHLLDEAERVYVSDCFPNVRPIPALKARLHLARGESGEALVWVRESGLSVQDDLSYLREFEHITLARVLLAGCATEGSQPALHEVTQFLERLLTAAKEGAGREASSSSGCFCRSPTRNEGTALPRSHHWNAVTLAEPEGCVRVIVDEGPPMASLLKGLAKQATARDYVRRLHAAITTLEHRPADRPGLIEPLSERELDVLRLLGTDLDGPDIAQELLVSLSTVRTHTQKIYAKLGVNNRRAAVRVAEELNLLPRSGGR
ncbi:MAG TPA: LuxR C-terminal-related transcriptional regulator [Actinomycetes bacterium]